MLSLIEWTLTPNTVAIAIATALALGYVAAYTCKD